MMTAQAATTPEAFAPVIVQVLLALAIAVAIIVVSHIFGQRPRRKVNEYKDSPYECGLPMQGRAHPRFGVKFYVTAMLFIIFDMEVVFMFPLATVYRSLLQVGAPILVPMLAFLMVLVIGLVYELKKGALRWDR